MASKLFGYYRCRKVSLLHFYDPSRSTGVHFGIVILQHVFLNFNGLKRFSNTWDVRLEMSLVCTGINLWTSGHVKTGI